MKKEKIGEKIKRYRLASDLSQQQLAQKANISRMSIVKYENKSQVPSLKTIEKVAIALNIKPDKLINETTQNENFATFVYEVMNDHKIGLTELSNNLNIDKKELQQVLAGEKPAESFVIKFARLYDLLNSVSNSNTDSELLDLIAIDFFTNEVGYSQQDAENALLNNQKQERMDYSSINKNHLTKHQDKINKIDISNAIDSYKNARVTNIYLNDDNEGYYRFVDKNGAFNDKAQKELRAIIKAFFNALNSN